MFIFVDDMEKTKKRHWLSPIVNRSGYKKVWLAEQLGISKSLFSHYMSTNRRMPEHLERALKEMVVK